MRWIIILLRRLFPWWPVKQAPIMAYASPAQPRRVKREDPYTKRRRVLAEVSRKRNRRTA